MNAKSIFQGVAKTIGFVFIGLILLLCGLLIMIYSPWAQETAREALLNKYSQRTDGTTISVSSFRLRFPLDLNLGDVLIVDKGDTMVTAGSIRAQVKLLPLLAGNVAVERLALRDVGFRMGGPDSLMYMTVKADSLGISPANVSLGSTMEIDLEDGGIRGGEMALVLRTDTLAAPKAAAPTTKMRIKAGNLALDDFTYSMRLMPTIDTLRAHIGHAVLNGGNIDLENQRIALGTFSGQGLDARYIVPDSAMIAACGPYPVAPADTASMPWVVEIDSISFDHSRALYATAGIVPVPGLDFAYISVDDVDLRLHDFYNCQTTVKLPLYVSGRERCGVSLTAQGVLDIDSTAISFKDFGLETAAGTRASFAGKLGMGDMMTDPDLPLALQLDGAFSPEDLSDMFPMFKPYLIAIPSADDVLLTADLDGTTGDLEISELALRLNGCVSLSAEGKVENCMNPDKIGGDLSLKGNIINVTSLKNAFLPAATAKTISVPPMALRGRVNMRQGNVSGNLAAVTSKGDIRMKANWNSRREAYALDLSTNTFPVDAFMPLLGLGAVTANINVDGKGYDPFKANTSIDAAMDISAAEYMGTVYKDITGKATLHDGEAKVILESDNSDLDFTVNAAGNLTGETYEWTASVDGRNIDLQALKLSGEPSNIELTAEATATIGPGKNDMAAHLKLHDAYYRRLSGTIELQDVDAHFRASDSLTTLNLQNRDLTATFNSPVPLDTLMARFTEAGAILSHQVETYFFNVDSIGKSLPPFKLDLTAGKSNMINDILAPSDMSLRSLVMTVDNDSTLSLAALAQKFKTGDMTIDTVRFDGRQHHDHFHFQAGVRNMPGNLDEWHTVDMHGRLDGNKISLDMKQQNAKGKTGFAFGMLVDAQASDSTFTLSVDPLNPTIGYQQWEVNEGNFISYALPTGHIDANLHMKGGNSSLAIFTEHTAASDSLHAQEDLAIQLTDIHISDWIALNPFAPPVKGDVSADMRLNRDNGHLVGRGSAGISNFFYGRERVADFKTNFSAVADNSGAIRAKADLLVDGVKTMTISGALNDSTAVSPLALDFSLIHFPLATVNPFLPAGTAKLRGVLNGTMDISGETARPVFNGWLDFDSTAVRVAMTATDYTFSPVKIPVENSIVKLEKFAISGCNDNPLTIDGTVDLSRLEDISFNLALAADNMQVVNSSRASKGADLFGKGFVSLQAKARGNMSLMAIDAKASVDAGTNITYVMPEASSMITNYSTGDMVKFVNFNDSTAVAADTIQAQSMAMFLDAVLTIEEGTILNVDLSADGKNKVQLQSNGTLTYAMTPMNTGRLTGRLNINQGFVRYSPPVISEKYFTFDDGSYISFNGDMMNPTLNVHAVDVIKSNVNIQGQNSRMVNFDVMLGVTGTLENMDVKFDLATTDDITIANELSSMSPEQRANQAMNLLLYNVYTSGSTSTQGGNMGTNALFSFLESQINSWAASAIKGVDISFGIDQYDKTVNGSTSSAMTYSYQVSKSLFNDRFKIVVGGNYTDANTDENFSQNLINDISFEYFLNKTRTMYVRLFRHTGYESILEGEITQTGVGFVYRRKLNRVGDMFLSPSRVRKRLEKEAAKEKETIEETMKEAGENEK